MSESINVNLFLGDIASAVDHDLDSLFNALGYHLAGQAGSVEKASDKILSWMEKRCGSELDDDGKAFLRACADYFNRQFPGEIEEG